MQESAGMNNDRSEQIKSSKQTSGGKTSKALAVLNPTWVTSTQIGFTLVKEWAC